jgi:uncharacterized membrane protein
MRRSADLSTPRGGMGFGLHYDPEAFGRFSEAIARTLGTARFLVFQTGVVTIWVAINAIHGGLRFDPYPFILLTLALSLQAAYAAPLILLAQNRQEARDRAESEQDRLVVARTQAETEYLAREVASIRIAIASLPTAEEFESAVERLTAAIDRLAGKEAGEAAT